VTGLLALRVNAGVIAERVIAGRRRAENANVAVGIPIVARDAVCVIIRVSR